MELLEKLKFRKPEDDACHHEHHEHEEHEAEHAHHHEHHHHEHDCCHEDGCGCGHDHGEKGKQELLRLGVAFVFFLIALFLKENMILYYAFSIAALLIAGLDTFRESLEHIKEGKVFDECFLMSIATIGALCIGEAAEGAAVMIFYGVGEYVQGLAVSRSTRAVESLLSLCPDTAHKETESGWEDVDAASLAENDVIRILPGERIPTDGVVIAGHAAVDASSVTGESLPVAAMEGTELLSGSIVSDGELRLRVTSVQKESYAAKMMAMVKDAKESKAPTEQFIHRFAHYYTPIVVFAALFLAIIPPLFVGGWTTWIYRALLFLVASCPCALVLSVPLGFFAGLGNASKHGIFLKGTTHIETLAKCNHIAFDKTGTLTEGALRVNEIHPIEGLSEEVFLTILSSLEKLSAHPIAKAIATLGASTVEIEDFQEIAGSGVSGNYKEHSFLAGNGAFLADAGIKAPAVGSTALYLGINGHYAGYVTFRDELRADSKDSVARLKEMGMDCVILSGDTPDSVAPIAKELEVRFDAGLLPHEKLEKVESMEGITAFVGDGINDSPALAAADLGIAMGAGGRDAAIETADVVLTKNSIHPVADAISIAKATMRTVWINIAFALAIKLLVMILGAFGIATMAWAVFADVGVCLIAVLHSLYLVFRKTTA